MGTERRSDRAARVFTDEECRQFAREGYLIARQVVPARLVDEMRGQIESIIRRAVDGEFGRDFRWTDEAVRLPAFINDLLTPAKYHRAFGELFAEIIIPAAEQLLGKAVRSSWLLLLTSGAGQSYRLPLHRDNNSMGAPDEEDLNRRLHLWQCYVQAPLQPHDNVLQLIPESHLRIATEEEIRAATLEGNVEAVTGLVTIDLEPGDIVFRSTNTLHRGWNPRGVLRWTLVSGLWADELPLMEIERQDFAGVCDPEFVAGLPSPLRDAVGRYLEAYRRENDVGAARGGTTTARVTNERR